MKKFINSILNKYIYNNNEIKKFECNNEYATEIKRITDENRNKEFEETIKNIKTRIEEAAQKGKNYIEYTIYNSYAKEWLINNVENYFKKLGFDAMFDEICECITIKW